MKKLEVLLLATFLFSAHAAMSQTINQAWILTGPNGVGNVEAPIYGPLDAFHIRGWATPPQPFFDEPALRVSYNPDNENRYEGQLGIEGLPGPLGFSSF